MHYGHPQISFTVATDGMVTSLDTCATYHHYYMQPFRGASSANIMIHIKINILVQATCTPRFTYDGFDSGVDYLLCNFAVQI